MHRVLHPFCFFIARRENRPLKSFMVRDMGAAYTLLEPLWTRGFQPGPAILNHPGPVRSAGSERPPLPVDPGLLEPGHVLLQTTRPPLDDISQHDRSPIERGHTDVEEALFGMWREYFEVISRQHVLLSSRYRNLLQGPYVNRRDLEFKQNGAGHYKRLNSLEGIGPLTPPPCRSAAFFLRRDEIWPGGPGLIAAFGMDGDMTQAWTARLARDFSWLLDRPGFAMVELRTRALPLRYTDLSWAMDWNFELLFHAEEHPGQR